MGEKEIQPLLEKYIFTPHDPEVNFWLAWEYEKIGQNASALSYYLRCAELSDNKDLVYECLLKTWYVIHKTKRRPVYCQKQLVAAITHSPKRPEAYFLLSRLHELKEEWKDAYYYASVALEVCDINLPKCKTDVDYPGDYILHFQHALTSWYVGQREQSKNLWKKFIQIPSTPKYYYNIAINNLKKIGLTDENIKPLSNNFEEKIDIILQGPYKDHVLKTAEHYLNLPFINNIIISCWKGDNTPSTHHNNIFIIKNDIPKSDGTANRNLQIVSSLKGLEFSNSKLAVKMRNDQKYDLDSMKNMYDFYFEHQVKPNLNTDHNLPLGKIFTAGIFEGFPLHPRDGIFWGYREDLIKLFSCPLEPISIHEKANIGKREYWKYYKYYIRTESYLGVHYASNFNDEVKEFLLDPKTFLFDEAPKYKHALKVSEPLTKKLFKSFPKTGIDLEWITYGWETYPYENQYNNFNERWHENDY
jgi:hypothetical protein